MSHPLRDLGAVAARRRRVAILSVVAMVTALLGLGLAPVVATAAVVGTGAVSVKGPNGELLPGTTVEIRKGSCAGPAVWHTTTASTPQAYGAFGIGLEAGEYCVRTLAAPPLYGLAADQMITVQARPGNWFTVWLPGPVTGAVVAKDTLGNGVNGVTALTTAGPCAAPGGGVWQNTTATSRWSEGGYGIALLPGTYCTTAVDVPSSYDAPPPVQTVVTAPGPVWITLWMPARTVRGWGSTVIPVAVQSGERIVDLSCPACTGNTVVRATRTDGSSDLLVDEVGAYSGRTLVGFADFDLETYTGLQITATGSWTLRLLGPEGVTVVDDHAAGTGDDVVFFRSRATGQSATFSHHGDGHFLVWSTVTEPWVGVEVIVDETGEHRGTAWMESPALVQVRADGAWDITTH